MGRTADNMLIYTADRVIFDTIMRRAFPEQEAMWDELDDDIPAPKTPKPPSPA